MFIEIHDIRKSYGTKDNRVEVLKGIDLSVSRGEFVILLGPSGSGKSTLLNMIGLIDLPNSGSIILEGTDVYKGIDLEKSKKVPFKLDSKLTELRRSHLGFIFQTFNLIPVLNVWENIEFPLTLGPSPASTTLSASEKRDWIEFLLETVGLSDWRNHKPSELSGGQRQRVAIARALVTKAPVILADEPTANLDSKNGDQILELMKKLNQELKTTFVFSTHDAKIVALSDHVIKIRDGKIQD